MLNLLSVKPKAHQDGEWELIGGMPYAMSPSPSVTHQLISTNIATSLKNSLSSNKSLDTEACIDCLILIKTDWQVSNDTVVRPNVMVVCKAAKEKIVATPDLIVEVVSNSSTKRDELMEFELFQQEGVLYYILVYPDKRIAKAYINKGGCFTKLGDYSSDAIEFDNSGCSLSLDFKSVWRKP